MTMRHVIRPILRRAITLAARSLLCMAVPIGSTGAQAGRAQAGRAPAPDVVIVRAARLIDGRGGAPLEPAMVRIEGERPHLARGRR